MSGKSQALGQLMFCLHRGRHLGAALCTDPSQSDGHRATQAGRLTLAVCALAYMRIANRPPAGGNRDDCGTGGHIVPEIGPARAGIAEIRSRLRSGMLHRDKQAAIIGRKAGAAQFRPARCAQKMSGQGAAWSVDVAGP